MGLSFKQSDCTCSDALNCCQNENRNCRLKHFAVPLPISTGTNQSLWCYDRIIITRSIPWPVMPHQLISNHANSLCTINRTPFSSRKNFNYMCPIVGRKCRFVWLYLKINSKWHDDIVCPTAFLTSRYDVKSTNPPTWIFKRMILVSQFKVRIKIEN